MLELQNFTAHTYDVDKLTLQWEFADTTENLSDYNLELYRSESPSTDGLSDFSIVTSSLTANDFSHVDDFMQGIYDPNRLWYYKFKIINSITGDFTVQPEYPIYPFGEIEDYRSRYILRWKNRSLNRLVGVKSCLIKRRTWGEKCEKHWDEMLQRSTYSRNEDCDCYGTGFVGGYFDPVPFMSTKSVNPTTQQITIFGKFRPSDAVLYTVNFPPLRPSDVIAFDNTSDRYVVNQIRTIEKFGKVVEQQAQISLIHPDDVVYEIPIDDSIFDYQGISTQTITGSNSTIQINGWSPELAVIEDGDRRVLQVSDWIGGDGDKPDIGQYIGANGFEALISNGVDIRGDGNISSSTIQNIVQISQSDYDNLNPPDEDTLYLIT